MSERNLVLLLEDVKDSIIKILDYTNGMDFDQYDADSKTKDAVERNFEIIGEAVSRIPDDFKKKYTHIEWRIIKDFRNFIIHEYFGIDNRIVWETIKNRLPELLNEFSVLIKNEEE